MTGYPYGSRLHAMRIAIIVSFSVFFGLAAVPAYGLDAAESDGPSVDVAVASIPLDADEPSAEASLSDVPAADALAGTEAGVPIMPASEATQNGEEEPAAAQPADASVTEPVASSIAPASAALDACADDSGEGGEEPPSYEESHVNMYRLYNANTGEHFYTSSESEAMAIAAIGWQWEGIGWVAPISSDFPVYRLYNPVAGDHHYTTSAKERDNLVKKGWRYEGIGWYSDSEDQLAILREYNPNAKTGSHNFTKSTKEDAALVAAGWTSEGVAFYATNGSALSFTARWLVSPAWTGSLERYWIDSNASIAKSRLVTASEGAGYTAYARPNGIIVRGKWDNNAGRVYVANNDGKLASTPDGKTGWLVTKAYDGVLQRYRYDGTTHSMLSGFFVVDGARYFGVGGKGYVLRGKTNWGDHVLLADNDGIMPAATGWLVTGTYDGSVLQRYWLERVYNAFVGARTGFFNAEGSKYFGVYNEGYVFRNDFIKDGGTWYKADNDGKLVKSVPPAQYLMTEYAQRFSSATRWLIMINLDTAMMGVYTGSQGNWTCVHYWLCSPGKPSTPTVTGTFTTLDRKPHLSTAYSARYCTRFYGGYFIHSILGTGNELGSNRYLSHGCVRVEVDNAKWVYENVPLGTTVHVYN